ncbi:hypothetical protein PHYBOEH_009341 [Phytophthora boehmeriae]|uniref:Uncharacterized protein n=1 Tax=Phytophthora boehmeriae TaxID=109152 RepID=A0A8T1VU16_9STRA|nr:hypothetical protein PHYBOEH_009341 [Phytophthora boehmeriae]
MVPDFKTVATISHPSFLSYYDAHVQTALRSPPKKTGLPQQAKNTPEALVGKLMWMTPEQLDTIGYTLEAVHTSRNTYKVLLLKAMELLWQLPQTRFYKAALAQQTCTLDRIRAAMPGEAIGIAEYAFTLDVVNILATTTSYR